MADLTTIVHFFGREETGQQIDSELRRQGIDHYALTLWPLSEEVNMADALASIEGQQVVVFDEPTQFGIGYLVEQAKIPPSPKNDSLGVLINADISEGDTIKKGYSGNPRISLYQSGQLLPTLKRLLKTVDQRQDSDESKDYLTEDRKGISLEKITQSIKSKGVRTTDIITQISMEYGTLVAVHFDWDGSPTSEIPKIEFTYMPKDHPEKERIVRIIADGRVKGCKAYKDITPFLESAINTAEKNANETGYIGSHPCIRGWFSGARDRLHRYLHC